jgi:hypothetical protein
MNSVTAVGYQSLRAVAGDGNTAIGDSAGLNTTTGSNNTFVGRLADATALPSATFSTAIGYNSQITASNQIVLGRVDTDSVQLNKITPMYSSLPSLTSANIGGDTISPTISFLTPWTNGQLMATSPSLPIGFWAVCVNLTFTGTSSRITGDFSSNPTVNRVLVQTSILNSSTTFGIIPNGAGATANFASYGNSADPANSSIMFVGISNVGTEIRLNSTISGTGSYLPITFYAGGSERVRIATNGVISLGAAPNAESLRVTPVASSVNYLNISGSTGTTPTLSAAGTGVDVDVLIAPKGVGNVSFGTYTAGVLAQTGYITIKDAGGTVRRLLVG